MLQAIVAAGSQLAADAGAEIANQGGNAVDAAIAAAIASMCTELGVMAPGASGFIVIWPPGEEPIAIDAYAEMPGRGLSPERLQVPPDWATIDYGGSMTTGVGYRAIATPGIFAGLSQASAQYGRRPWSDLLQPTIQYVEQGFPLSACSAEYLSYSHKAIFGWHPDSARTIRHPTGRCLIAGETVRIPELARSLEQIAQQGTTTLYGGDLGQRITDEIQAKQGLLTLSDLQAYEAINRVPLQVKFGDWQLAINPPPAVGGTCLAAMLLLCDRASIADWSAASVAQLAKIQQTVLHYRHHNLDCSHDNARAAAALLERAQVGDLLQHKLQSPSTIHISATDSQGLACSITASAGYGSGAMIAGTGLWLNNSLGELELRSAKSSPLTPGTRLISNMAPTIARRPDGAVMAIGSPGASRITTAIAQVLLNYIQGGYALPEAVAQPRLHVEISEETPTVSFEQGIAMDAIANWQTRPFPALHMYFGGVQATLWDPQEGLSAVADPRRAGGVAQG